MKRATQKLPTGNANSNAQLRWQICPQHPACLKSPQIQQFTSSQRVCLFIVTSHGNLSLHQPPSPQHPEAISLHHLGIPVGIIFRAILANLEELPIGLQGDLFLFHTYTKWQGKWDGIFNGFFPGKNPTPKPWEKKCGKLWHFMNRGNNRVPTTWWCKPTNWWYNTPCSTPKTRFFAALQTNVWHPCVGGVPPRCLLNIYKMDISSCPQNANSSECLGKNPTVLHNCTGVCLHALVQHAHGKWGLDSNAQ